MNDPRIDAFLAALHRDLRDFFPAPAADERLREMRGHLREAVAQAERDGAPDPVAAALAEFGSAPYRAPERIPERAALRWAAALLLVPIALDLAMDLSSWATGSDSSVWALSVPLGAVLAFRFAAASSRVRRVLAAPLLGLTLGAFLLFSTLGGFTRATAHDGLSGTTTRGTALRRRNGIVERALPEKQALLDDLRRASAAFAPDRPTPAVGDYRVASGYLTPTIDERTREVWKGDPYARREMIRGLRYVGVPDYAAARTRWIANGPEIVRYAQSAVQAERDEVATLLDVATCPWWTSVRADAESKTVMGLVAGAFLLTVHVLGLAGGAVFRRRRRMA